MLQFPNHQRLQNSAGVSGAAVVWDMDGVLVGTVPALKTAWTAFVQEIFSITCPDKARKLVDDHYNTYGSTPIGCAHEPKIPESEHAGFVAAAESKVAQHIVENRHALVRRSPNLEAGMRRLQGKLEEAGVASYVFTNAPGYFAGTMLNHVGLSFLQHQLITAEDVGGIRKVHKAAYEGFIERTGIDPERSVMIDDHTSSLRPASEVGMRTVFIGQDNGDRPDYVDDVYPGTLPLLLDILEKRCLERFGISL